MILLMLYVKNDTVFLIVSRAILKFQLTLYFCKFQPRAEIVHVIVNIFSPFNWAEFNPGVEKAPCNQALSRAKHEHINTHTPIHALITALQVMAEASFYRANVTMHDVRYY